MMMDKDTSRRYSANFINSIGWVGFSITLLILLFTDKCSQDKTIEHTTVVKNYYDSSVRIIPVPYMLPKDSIIVEIPQNVDTTEIFKEFFTKFHYAQTIEDSNLTATISDTIFKNHLLSRNFSYKWKQPVKIVTETKNVLPPPRFLIGSEIFINKNQFDLTAGFIYQHGNTAFTAKYAVLSKSVLLGAYLQPSFKLNGKRKTEIYK